MNNIATFFNRFVCQQEGSPESNFQPSPHRFVCPPVQVMESERKGVEKMWSETIDSFGPGIKKSAQSNFPTVRVVSPSCQQEPAIFAAGGPAYDNGKHALQVTPAFFTKPKAVQKAMLQGLYVPVAEMLLWQSRVPWGSPQYAHTANKPRRDKDTFVRLSRIDSESAYIAFALPEDVWM